MIHGVAETFSISLLCRSNLQHLATISPNPLSGVCCFQHGIGASEQDDCQRNEGCMGGGWTANAVPNAVRASSERNGMGKVLGTGRAFWGEVVEQKSFGPSASAFTEFVEKGT